MNQKTHLIIPMLTSVYLLIIFLTDTSFRGYWTDFFIAVVFVTYNLKKALNSKKVKGSLSLIHRFVSILPAILVYSVLAAYILNPFSWNVFKMKCFYNQEVNGRLFNAYFKPVGANSGGEGIFWITESPKYFPLIETQKYYDNAVLWDFSVQEWEGETVDQNEIVKRYIEQEITDR